MKIVFQFLGKEFSYIPTRIEPIINVGKIRDLYYMILDLGTHPTAYIGVEKGHKLYGEKYDDVDIDVHGGLTFCGIYETIYFKDPLYNEIYWFGWDYAHMGDYLGWDSITPAGLRSPTDKKWKFYEVMQEVTKAIEELEKL